MKSRFGFSIFELEEMPPFEREIYLTMINNNISENDGGSRSSEGYVPKQEDI